MIECMDTVREAKGNFQFCTSRTTTEIIILLIALAAEVAAEVQIRNYSTLNIILTGWAVNILLKQHIHN